jgi:hypothetical protein
MSTLHGILAELGIDSTATRPEREVSYTSQWVVDEDFIPQAGKSYEIAFGRVPFAGHEQNVTRRVRVEHVSTSGWIDQESGNPLDPELAALPVKAFRVLD